MPSAARLDFDARLGDVAKIIEAYALVPRTHRGALVKAGVVFLAAATETFVEDLFEEAAHLIFTAMSPKDFSELFKDTSERLHSPKVFKIERLFVHIGMRSALGNLSWQGFGNSKVRKVWDELMNIRDQVAHGQAVAVPLANLKRWQNMIERFVPIFEAKVADQVESLTGQRPTW
jgi:hypothetical protein